MSDIEQQRQYDLGVAAGKLNEHKGNWHIGETWFQSQAYTAGYEVGVAEARAEKAASGKR